MKLRVSTFNIANTSIHYRERRKYILKTTKDMDCDIIGLQEINYTGNTELQELTEYNLCLVDLFEPLYLPIPEFKIDGNGVLIRKNIKVLENHRLVFTDHLRVAQFLKLEKDGIKFVFINTHLDYLLEEIKETEINEIKDFFKQFEGLPAFCTGDFNFVPGSSSYNSMSAEFRSLHLEVNGKEPDLTYPTMLEDTGAQS